jgi:hypothetical protein
MIAQLVDFVKEYDAAVVAYFENANTSFACLSISSISRRGGL